MDQIRLHLFDNPAQISNQARYVAPVKLPLPALPGDLRRRMYAWLDENAQSERKAGDSDDQFYYKARKKAIGPFKQDVWSLPEPVRAAISADLERTFAFLFEQLNVNGTADLVDRFVQAPMQHHAQLDQVLVRATDDAEAGE